MMMISCDCIEGSADDDDADDDDDGSVDNDDDLSYAFVVDFSSLLLKIEALALLAIPSEAIVTAALE